MATTWLPSAPGLPELRLRPAGPEDREALFALHKASLGQYIAATWGWDEAWQRQHFIEHFEPSKRSVVIAAGEEVGCIGVERRFGHLFLAYVAIRPDRQGRGLGTRLIRDVIDESEARGIPVRLGLMTVNPVRALYERLGFEVTGTGERRLEMERRAGAALPGGEESLPYRAGAGAVFVREDGAILGCSKSDWPGMWQLPQGGIDPAEDPDMALDREMSEELGTDRFAILRRAPRKTRYEFPDSIRAVKKRRGQEHDWYLLAFTGGGAPRLDASDGELAATRWMRPEELLEQVHDWKKLAYLDALRLLEVPCAVDETQCFPGRQPPES